MIMGPFEAVVVFVVVWWLAFLPILSAGTRSQEEAGEVAPGTERAAPVAHRLPLKAAIATAIASATTTIAWVLAHSVLAPS